MEQRDPEQKGSTFEICMLRCCLATESRIHQGKRAEEAAGSPRQLWMLFAARGLFALGTGFGTTQVESRSRTYFWLPMGALKQAQPSCKHISAQAGRCREG